MYYQLFYWTRTIDVDYCLQVAPQQHKDALLSLCIFVHSRLKRQADSFENISASYALRIGEDIVFLQARPSTRKDDSSTLIWEVAGLYISESNIVDLKELIAKYWDSSMLWEEAHRFLGRGSLTRGPAASPIITVEAHARPPLSPSDEFVRQTYVLIDSYASSSNHAFPQLLLPYDADGEALLKQIVLNPNLPWFEFVYAPTGKDHSSLSSSCQIIGDKTIIHPSYKTGSSSSKSKQLRDPGEKETSTGGVGDVEIEQHSNTTKAMPHHDRGLGTTAGHLTDIAEAGFAFLKHLLGGSK